jgi:hypothetical protein
METDECWEKFEERKHSQGRLKAKGGPDRKAPGR